MVRTKSVSYYSEEVQVHFMHVALQITELTSNIHNTHSYIDTDVLDGLYCYGYT